MSHAVMMVCELVDHTDDPNLPAAVGIACLEGWFTNYRLLIETFVLKKEKSRSHAADLLPGWEPDTSDPEQADRVERVKGRYGFINQAVSHIGTMKSTATAEGDYDRTTLLSMADDAVLVVKDWVDALDAADHDFAAFMQITVSRANESLATRLAPPG